jgi:Protein kinase domain/Lanthionine synthetase C-like protein
MDVLPHLHLCPPGTPYFDLPAPGPDEDGFPDAAVPAGWNRSRGSEWTVLTPPEGRLPTQGWKVHVSATPENAAHVLDVVVKYCTAAPVPFKFLRSRGVLLRRNGKYGDRSASGKFVTIYPADEPGLERVLHELGDLLDGQEGPYILSDLRWRSGPLYVRYGGFVERTARLASGRLEHCIEDPDGRLVPDRRGPGFHPPEWVRTPGCLDEALAARNAGTLRDFPYRVTGALHFSNGGGVYRGVDTRTGAAVLLREARPLAGLDRDGRDAVARLERERWALERLAGLPCVPALLDFRRGHEHWFLVREYVEGASLVAEVSRRNPLITGEPSAAAYEQYARWVDGVLDQLEHGIRALHERGVVFGDLHPANVLVRPDGAVVLIDFETATAAADQADQTMGAPGFLAPAGCRGPDVDLHALACMRLALLVPLAAALSWGPAKVDELATYAAERFPVEEGFSARVRADLGGGAADAVWDATDWPRLRQEIADGVLAAASPQRDDRLFPGDGAQFFTPEGGVSLLHGAAGVLWALAEVGVDVPAGHVDWLAAAAGRLSDPRPGAFGGLAGVALALHRLGRPTEACELAEIVARHPLDDVGVDLADGLAGIGLMHLHLARETGEGGFLAAARNVADRLVDHLTVDGDAARGLMRGPAGPALMLLRLHERDGGTALLDGAENALRRDLERLDPLPLVASGSAGIGMVLHDLVGHRPDPELETVLDAIRRAAERPFLPDVGMLHGRAGAVTALLHLGSRTDAALRAHVRGFGLHAVRHDGHPAFLGTECLRISTDLATGTAGVLLALQGALGDGRARLPVVLGS